MNIDDYYRITDTEKQRASGGAKGAVRAKCIDCVYDPAAPGTMAEQIHNCGVTTCSLYPYRMKVEGLDSPPFEPQEVLKVGPRYSKAWHRKDSLIREQQDKGTVQGAIAANCIDCNVSFASNSKDSPGSWRVQVSSCEQRDCPMWTVRPKSSKGGSGAIYKSEKENA